MVTTGCILQACLLGILLLFGPLVAKKFGVSPLWGLGAGIVLWLPLVILGAYMSAWLDALGRKLRFLIAGWRPWGNRLEGFALPAAPPLFPAAERILARFAGLRIGNDDESVTFDPKLAAEFFADLEVLRERLGRPLYPIALYMHQDPVCIVVDAEGVLYTLADGTLEPLASSFESAADYLVTFRAPPPRREWDLRPTGLWGLSWSVSEHPMPEPPSKTNP